MDKETLFNFIEKKCLEKISNYWVISTGTKNGNTQAGEHIVIEKICEIFNEENLYYEKAGSQQPIDFRNVGNVGLNIEIKKLIVLLFI